MSHVKGKKSSIKKDAGMKARTIKALYSLFDMPGAADVDFGPS